MATADPLAPLSPSARGPLTLAVECRTEPSRPGGVHQITLDAAWQVNTPHDLDAERVAKAFGGYLSCLELVDRVVPALSGLAQLVGRRRLPDVRRAGSADWRMAVPVEGCRCHGASFRAPELAAFHARGVEHWAALWDLSRDSVRLLARLVDEVARAHGIGERLGAHPARSAVLEGSGLDDLWQAGIHPELVTAMRDNVWPGGPPLPARFYLGAGYLGASWQWLADVAQSTGDADVLTWAAWTVCDLDRTQPEARLQWLGLRLPLHVIEQLMLGGYTRASAERLADLAGYDVTRAAAELAAWQAAGCLPEPHDLAALHRAGIDPWYRPSGPALDRLMDRVGKTAPGTDPPSRTQAGLVLAVARNVHLAATLLRRGIREPLAAGLALEGTP